MIFGIEVDPDSTQVDRARDALPKLMRWPICAKWRSKWRFVRGGRAGYIMGAWREAVRFVFACSWDRDAMMAKL